MDGAPGILWSATGTAKAVPFQNGNLYFKKVEWIASVIEGFEAPLVLIAIAD
jgi:hypothetical protein